MPRNPDKRPCSVEGCRAWAMRGSDPPLCAAHTGRAGAPRGNRNALVHGYYAQSLPPDTLDDLDGLDDLRLLDDQILILLLALRRLQRIIVTGTTPRPRPLDLEDYLRYIGLTFQGANTISRLLRHHLPDAESWAQLMQHAFGHRGRSKAQRRSLPPAP